MKLYIVVACYSGIVSDVTVYATKTKAKEAMRELNSSADKNDDNISLWEQVLPEAIPSQHILR
jgi:hypothetical protein